MADGEDRIRRMEAEGAISARQAEMLRASLAGRAPVAVKRRSLFPSRPHLVLWAALAAGAAILLAALLIPGAPTEIQDVAQALNKAGGHGEMSRALTSFLGIALLFVVPLLLFVYFHNSLVAKEETVSESWAQVESNFQRRADLVPALVQTVSRYLRHERDTFVGVTDERAQAAERLSTAIDRLIEAQAQAGEALREEQEPPPSEDQVRLEHLFAMQRAVGGRMGDVFAVAEAYPELRSSDQFLALQAQLEGTENRINVARQRFNDAVGDYNSALRMMPWNLVAALGGFGRKAYFQSAEEARNAPALAMD